MTQDKYGNEIKVGNFITHATAGPRTKAGIVLEIINNYKIKIKAIRDYKKNNITKQIVNNLSNIIVVSGFNKEIESILLNE